MQLPHKPAHYRPDIDGLRAVAIIPVLLFHAGVAGFAGGYVGVDIFFVISGFLITSIIMRELREGRFSLLTFWERRVRRIVPAAVVVTLATLVAGYFIILYPIDYLDLAQSAIAQAFFLANVFFFRKDDYFAGASEEMPLLHTWSLSVEEQFYIIFPLLLLSLYTYTRRALLPTLALIGLASLAYAAWLLSSGGAGFSIPGLPAGLWGSASNAEAAFYLLPARAFELLIGAGLALTAFSISNRNFANLATLAGVGLIAYSVTQFSSATAFPGLAALVPTLGTALIIAGNSAGQTFVGQVLSFPLLVGVGLISYSLYLWHWPVLVLLKHHYQRLELTQSETLLALLASFVLAYLTYRFIETPFRVKRLLPTRLSMLLAGTGALLLVAALSALIIAHNGLPQRAPAPAQQLAAATLDFGPRRKECFINSFTTGSEPCYLGTQENISIDFVLWGDSHAAALLPMIDQEARQRGLSGASFISAGCTPVWGYDAVTRTAKCERVTDLAYSFIQEHNVPQVLLVSRWSGALPHAATNTDPFAAAFATMNHTLTNAGTDVFIVAQVPKQPHFSVKDSFYALAKGDGERDAIPAVRRTNYERTHGPMNTLLTALASTSDVHLITPADTLCTDTTCRLRDTSRESAPFLYQDADHLNQTGAFFVAPVFEGFFTELQ